MTIIVVYNTKAKYIYQIFHCTLPELICQTSVPLKLTFYIAYCAQQKLYKKRFQRSRFSI